MTAAPFTDVEADMDENSTIQDNHSNSSSASSKLERRRRIEDINEERRLREELSEY